MKFSSPKIEVGSIIVSFRPDLKGVTPKRKYIVEARNSEFIIFRNDLDELCQYRSIYFMEADVIFSILLLNTIHRALDLENF